MYMMTHLGYPLYFLTGGLENIGSCNRVYS